jgi:hypothetical protein
MRAMSAKKEVATSGATMAKGDHRIVVDLAYLCRTDFNTKRTREAGLLPVTYFAVPQRSYHHGRR